MTVKVFHKLMPRTFRNERKFQIFIQESCFDFIPRAMKKPIYKLYLKDELYEKYGDSAFLIPEQKLFPIKNINTGQFDRRLIQYTLIRALALKRISSDYDYIYDAAISCFNEHNCEGSIDITLTETDEDVSLLDFLMKLDELNGEMEFTVPDDAVRTEEDLARLKARRKRPKVKFKRLLKTKSVKL